MATAQLRKIDSDLKDMNATLSGADRILYRMKSIGHSLISAFTGPGKAPDTSYSAASASSASTGAVAARAGGSKAVGVDGKAVDRSAASAAAGRAALSTSTAVMADGDADAAALAIRSSASRARTDAQLDALMASVNALKAQASDISTELDEHNAIIGHIDGVVDSTTHRVKHANRNINRILND
jgi:hypothetical protein